MKIPLIATLGYLMLTAWLIPSHAFAVDVGTEKKFDAPNGMTVNVKVTAPYSPQTDLQIICAFKHKSDGDTYIEAMKDFDDKSGGILSALRNRGEFTGELGETILFTPPAGTIPPSRVLVVGLGAEKQLSLDTMRVIGRVAVREAVRLKARNVFFAPVLRDQGNKTLDVGECDQAIMEGIVLAYDTEKRLQAQKLAEPFDISDWTFEAGPSFFDEVVQTFSTGIPAAKEKIAARNTTPYRTPVKP